MNTSVQKDSQYKMMRLIEAYPAITQRELSGKLGVSLGKANYCLRALIDKGWIKTRKFTKSNNKRAYAYLMTPEGIRQKAQLTAYFLQRKIREYDGLREEIDMLQRELRNS